MPALENPRWERFAQELAKGKTADESYQCAGYSEHRGNASRLSANENVLRRVAEIQERGAVRAEITREKLITRLTDLAVKAEGLIETQGATAVQATRATLMDIGKLQGWIIERKETGQPGEFEAYADARAIAEAIANRLVLAGPRDEASFAFAEQRSLRGEPN